MEDLDHNASADLLYQQHDLGGAGAGAGEARLADDPNAAAITFTVTPAPKEGEVDGFDAQEVRRQKKLFGQLAKDERERKLQLHGLHLQLLLASAAHMSKACDDHLLQCLCLSTLPTGFIDSAVDDPVLLTAFVAWTRSQFSLAPSVAPPAGGGGGGMSSEPESLVAEALARALAARHGSARELVQLAVAMLRALGHQVRFIWSVQPLPFRTSTAAEPARKRKKQGGASNLSTKPKASRATDGEPERSESAEDRDLREAIARSLAQPLPATGGPVIVCDSSSDEVEVLEAPPSVVHGAHDPPARMKRRRKRKESPPAAARAPESCTPCRRPLDSLAHADRPAIDCWVEVFQGGRWVSVDVMAGAVDRPDDAEANATRPVHYVLAVDGNGHVRDVTERYACNWMTTTAKQRINPDWWKQTLRPYTGPASKQDKEESALLAEHHHSKAIPTSLAAFKSHTLYAVERHLHKNQIMYPKKQVGMVKSEPVFLRSAVKTLRSREHWQKEARVVKSSEMPAKTVKASRSAKQAAGTSPGEEPGVKEVDLFGEWQTKAYVPPAVENGKVPRNRFGTVDLFKPCMLPTGGVHLPYKGVARTAAKLGIDAANAVTGFEFKSGSTRPVIEGVVVCATMADVLTAAWREDEDARVKAAAKKREDAIWKRWRTLIQKLLIREAIRNS